MRLLTAAEETMVDPEWTREPSIDRWEASGLRCLLLRHREVGHWCGYVRLKTGHPLYRRGAREPLPNLEWMLKRRLNEPMDDLRTDWFGLFIRALSSEAQVPTIESALSVHGGVTFVEYTAGKEWSGWGGGRGFWIGFDCAHFSDLSPMIYERFRSTTYAQGSTYRNYGYARAETERLAAQLSVLGGG